MNKVDTDPFQPEQFTTEPLHPVPVSHPYPQAIQRAPTLIAGATGGEQGQVIVWAPSIWRIRFGVLFIITLIIGIILATSFTGRTGKYMLFPAQMLIGYLGIGAWVSAWSGPRYITTDDAGIGITTRKGSCALRWNEIRSLEMLGRSDYILDLFDKQNTLNLRGHHRKMEKELVGLITEKANLHKHPTRQGLYETWTLPAQKSSIPAPGGTSSPSTITNTSDDRDEEPSNGVPRWAQAQRH